MNDADFDFVVSKSSYAFILLLGIFVPLFPVWLIYVIYCACSNHVNRSFKNFCRAILILIAIAIVISAVIYAVLYFKSRNS